MSVVAIPVEQARDVQIRMQEFKSKVDLIYVGTSGPIQPTLPVISAEARKMHIPVFNLQAQAVKDGLALASFGVDYTTVGRNAAKLTADVLRGQKISDLTQLYPKPEDHHSLINKKLATELGIIIPSNIAIVECFMINITKVIKSFQGLFRPVINDVSLSLERGDFCVLIRANGCGKSTLLKLIKPEHKADSGEIKLSGNVAQVLQDVNLGTVPEMTLLENVALSEVKTPKFLFL